MAKFITVTTHYGQYKFNIDYIVSYRKAEKDGGSIILLHDGRNLEVQESLDKIDELIAR